VVLNVLGKTSNTAFRTSLTTASDYVHLREGRLPVDASVIADKAGRTVLVFDPTDTLLESRIHPGLFSANHSVWTTKGLYRSFQGVTHTNDKLPRSRGDLVEQIDGSLLVTQPLTRHTTADLYAASPSTLVFIVRDASGVLPPVGRIQTSSAFHLWKAGFDGKNNVAFYRKRPLVEPKEGALQAAFQTFLREVNPPVFVVNVAGKEGSLSTADLDNVISCVLDGSASQAVVSPVKGLEIGAITKLPNFTQSVLNPYKGWKNKEEHHAAAIAMGKKLGFSV